MKLKLATMIFALVLSLSACAISPTAIQCRRWQNEGLVFSTLDACIACVKQLGSANPQAIQGCAIGMDAGTIMDLVNK